MGIESTNWRFGPRPREFRGVPGVFMYENPKSRRADTEGLTEERGMVILHRESFNQHDRSSTMPTVLTSAKGQVVIPKKERDRLGIKPGTRVVVTAVDDHIEIRPLPENPVEHFHGLFKKGPSLTKALLDERRKERQREEKKCS
jgi:AbrB family looped-hinge helix DNA binding protein